MGISNYGFTDIEIGADRITAYAAVWHEKQMVKGGFSLNAGSYGVVLAGRGTECALWGAGYTPDPTPMAAFAVQRLLAEYPDETDIAVFAHSELVAYVGQNPPGYARRSTFKGHKVFREIIAAMDARRWRPIGVSKEDHFYSAAEGLAKGPAKQAALVHKHEHQWSSHDHPVHAVVSTGP